jgi:predicted phage terminase large subunit-like protein
LTFIEFVKLVRPGYRWYKHCLVLAAVLQRVADGEIKRLMIFMPPRHGKSELASRLFTAYFLYLYPERFVGLASYSAGLAYTLSRASRENYKAAGGVIDGKANAVKQWLTGKGGGLWATGVGGEATGKGWHLGVIDDPLKNAEQAASPVIREKQKEWYGSTWYTREEPWSDTDPHGALIVINTRWNEDDLSGWLLAEEVEGEEPERWHIVAFKAIKEEWAKPFPATCTVEPDWRGAGEALCEERRPLAKLKRIAKRIGSYFWNALYQQEPRPKAGHKFKLSWFKDRIVGAAPVDAERVLYIDKAGTDGGGCYTAMVLLARDKSGRTFVEEVRRGQWSALEREERIKKFCGDVAAKYGLKFKVWLEEEGGSGGKESAEASVRNLAGYTVRTERVKGDKELRAEPFAAQCEAMNVWIVEGEWNKAYLDELTAFPFGKYKDQVDASSGAFNKLAGKQSMKFF